MCKNIGIFFLPFWLKWLNFFRIFDKIYVNNCQLIKEYTNEPVRKVSTPQFEYFVSSVLVRDYSKRRIFFGQDNNSTTLNGSKWFSVVTRALKSHLQSQQHQNNNTTASAHTYKAHLLFLYLIFLWHWIVGWMELQLDKKYCCYYLLL